MKFLNNEKGITLIALVITIIVLLILSAVSINLTFGENGIVTRTKDAKDNYKISEYKERIETIKTEGYFQEDLNVSLIDFTKEKLEKENWVFSVETNLENQSLAKNQIEVQTNEGYIIVVEFEKEDKDTLTKLEKINIPYKEKMTYYFDYQGLGDSEIENYGTGDVKIKSVNAELNDNSIYFSGENKSYAYTENNLGENNYFTTYFVAKFDNVYTYNYCISTLSRNQSEGFGIGIGRYGEGTNRNNKVIGMVSNPNNACYTEYDIKNYYVYAIVYNGEKVKFYIDGNLIGEMDATNSTTKFYFASYFNTSDNKVYGGSLIRFKQFAFVDDIHNEEQVKQNSEFLFNKYLND